MTMLEVSAIDKSFGRAEVLRSVGLTAPPGVTGLLGPNGAGKTTLLRILATVLARDSGTVELGGHDPERDPLPYRRRLGYMPQEPGFHRNFTVFEFVDFLAVLKEITDRRARHDEVRRVIEMVGLTASSAKKIRKLSGGQRRRVALAQALLGDPDLLILDEPTAGLDPEQRLQFRQLVSAIAADRIVLLSTHLTDDVSAIAAHIIVLDDGIVRFDGNGAQLAEHGTGRVWLADEQDRGAQLSWRTGDGRHRHVGDPPEGAELIAPSLEDGYLLLVGANTEPVAT
jgi:ABC-2 type transport system ATP-binding protein